jgi:hypothetical protein
MAQAIPLPRSNVPEQTNTSHLLFPLVQICAAMVLGAMVLDGGECFQRVCYALAAYVGGLLLMVLRKETLTKVDEFLIRWGFVLLCVIFFLSMTIWSVRG